MAKTDFYIKQNDTKPALNVSLAVDGSVVDLTDAVVKFHMGSIVDATATVVSATAGTVRYSWIAADTVLAGCYPAEFEVTFTDGSIETFPNDWDNRLTVIIPEDVS